MRPAPTPASPSLPGALRIVRALGAGGLCEAHLATRDGGDAVVLKRLLPHLRDQAAWAEMLAHEAQVLGCVDHPRVARLVGAGIHDGVPAIAYEHARGEDLRAVLERLGRPLTASRALPLLRDIADGLVAIHAALGPDGGPLGLVHRDVCPENIIVSPEGRATLIDLGIARTALGAALRGPGDVDEARLQGRAAYLAPEDARGEPVDARADQFALAVIAWELLAGQRLFRRGHAAAALHAVVHEDAPPLPGTWPPGTDAVLARGLAKTKAARFDDVRAFTDALAHALG